MYGCYTGQHSSKELPLTRIIINDVWYPWSSAQNSKFLGDRDVTGGQLASRPCIDPLATDPLSAHVAAQGPDAEKGVMSQVAT